MQSKRALKSTKLEILRFFRKFIARSTLSRCLREGFFGVRNTLGSSTWHWEGGLTATYLACEASPESDTLTLSNAIWLSGIVQLTAFRRRSQIFFYNKTLDCIGTLLYAEQSSSPMLQIAKWPEEEEKKAAFCAIFLFLGTTRTRTICTRTTRARKTQQQKSSSSQALEGCRPT